MAYNFPVGYQPAQIYYPQSNYQTNPQQQAQAQSGIIWVQGEAGAKSYLVAPNTTVQLWDSEAQTIYLKSADASGMPSIKTLDYTVRERVQAEISHDNQAKVEFVTRQEFDALKAEIQALTAIPKKSTTKKTEVKDDVE